jgi:cytochrome c-type biogenesis protein
MSARPPTGGLLVYAAPLAVAAVVTTALVLVRDGAAVAVAGTAELLPFGWAFAAGMVASVNPCGFFMLPAYLSYQLGIGEAGFESAASVQRGLRALVLGLTATTGFVAVMGVVGTLVAVGGQWLVRVFPYAGLAVGAALAGLGLWLLVTGRTLRLEAARRVTVSPRRSRWNVFLFGIAYAIGSLSCTLPIFLLVVGSSLAARGFVGSVVQFVSYALGMGSILIVVTIGAALSGDAVAGALRWALPHVHRMSAIFLIGAGGYLIYYWGWFSGLIF